MICWHCLPARAAFLQYPTMQDDIPLRPATREEIEHTLSYGLRFGTTGKAHHLASESTARIAAQVLCWSITSSNPATC